MLSSYFNALSSPISSLHSRWSEKLKLSMMWKARRVNPSNCNHQQEARKSLSKTDSDISIRQLLTLFFLSAALFHLYFNDLLLREALESGNNDASSAAYAIAYQYMKTPLLRNTGNNMTSENTSSKLFGERKRARLHSQGGINSKHVALDEDWIAGVSTLLGCPEFNSGGIVSEYPNNTNIPTIETWNALYQAYHATVDPDNELLSATEYQNSWKVSIEVKFQRPEGRGVYAKEFIPKGTHVWSSTSRNTATFLSHHDRREFIKYLVKDPTTRTLACDVRSWVDFMLTSDGTYLICETFDEAVLLNTVWDENSDGDVNIEPQFISLTEDNPDFDENDCYGNDHFFATRDIQAGEQFRIHY
ncbi:SET methyltransferase domain containing protein [Nitzschia inconspicua]|uniref:SET methyltransferase domain containing protein n=1 Tax=Nitzschia inconspicua TaxID=303405 RepID=A0A9K3Q9I6_9STRA|nr:SET methyltransferase domain containing protein [Nitzschia inconspicua]